MSVKGEPPLISLVLLQLVLLFGGIQSSSIQHTNELGSSRTNGVLPPQTPCPQACDCSAPSPPTSEAPQSAPPALFSIVTCSGQNITSIPDGIPVSTRKLDLSTNNISWVDHEKLGPLQDLHELSLSSNLIEELGESSFSSLSNLKELTLSRNQLTAFPTTAIPNNLELLNLEYNKISQLERHILPKNSKLHALLLGGNVIEKIDDSAFDGLELLQLLELDGNRLLEVPRALRKLTALQELSLANNRIALVDIPFHQIIPGVKFLLMRGNPLHNILPDAFSHLKHLKKLILSDVKNLTQFPDLNGTSSIEILRIDRCSVYSVPSNLCEIAPKLKSLDLKSNKLQNIPSLQDCKELRILELSVNEIENLKDGAFKTLSELHDLHLHHNRISKLTSSTFAGLVNLQNLDLAHNNINFIHPDTFLATPKLEDLNLGNNFFPDMPTKGLDRVVELKTFNNPNLREFPGPESFPRARRLVLSYAYHCCQFVADVSAPTSSKSFFDQSPIEESVLYPTEVGFRNALSELNLTDSWQGIVNLSNKAELAADFWETFGTPLATDSAWEEGSGDGALTRVRQFRPKDISCIPLPGPFLPCKDLFDWWTLRCGVWIVFLLALMGNGTVVFVQIFARTKMDVPRFLVCNLAIAGFLAVIDAATLGEFRKFAIPWQLSIPCQVAGFLGVLSSELGVFTLTVITLERHYVITHAMHLNKRLSLKHASYIMVIGWIFALIMAVLPLFGVSDYRKFAVCLPFETGDGVSLGYGIAKNMALLVFTDLLCWFPIAFFSLTAAFGLQLVSLEEAKVFTVFILPLNSCCNPFLYAILTKQFKKDCVLICKAIEESRVTRGIGRCRNSSNFSNRQTAPNTGSLTDKVSKDGQPCICHSGLHPGGDDVNGNAKYHRFIPAPEQLSRLGPFGRFFSRYILCQNSNKDSSRQREDPRMQNVRRYLYNTATANYPPDSQKHQRHPSVSSDNFSSSRSDSWRVQNRSCGLPLRLLEPRRRNSWAVTRKPSQESNLSSSRNDSSATSNSTATWRLSRSSVSSDANSHSGGGKSSFKKIPLNSAVNTSVLPGGANQNSCVTTTATVNRPKNLPTTAAGAAAVLASGPSGTSTLTNNISLQQQQQQGSSVNPSVNNESDFGINRSHMQPSQTQGNPNMQRRSSNPKTVTIADPLVKRKGQKKKKKGRKKRVVRRKPDADVIIIDDDEASAKIATNRPRLVRQSAFFSEEVIIEPEVCPVHGPLNYGTYDDDDEDEEAVSDIDEGDGDEDDDDDESDEEGESEGENSSPTDPILKPQGGGGQIGIALVIVPRRLSTISSRDTLSIRSRDESDHLLNECGFSGGGGGVSPGSNFNPSTSSPGPSGYEYSPNGPSTLLLPAGFGRRKMSEQPNVQFFVVPASSGLLSSAKWHSMSSVESGNQSNNQQPIQVVQAAHFVSSPSQSRSQSRSQSPRGLRANMKHDGQKMTSMVENQQEEEIGLCCDDREETPPGSREDTGPSNSNLPARNFGFRDPNERRVSFQLPTVTVAMLSGDGRGESATVNNSGDPTQSSEV
ncbi:Leucine-rich repeat-containing G-protein coupled receptor 5 [Folsomia candida]|uniref:Leucine-rich repeat-containing G-protein coupled receptor 5 n=1 Tax=Folsomia candida TaxID=158441 RepID=A0A226F298_FOLCA|nr:Leucine-rich repeat-containing G-protein coupled receptor 5 [Folsomia candida]